MNHKVHNWMRWIALLLSLALLVPAIAGCKKQTKEPADLSFSAGSKAYSVKFQGEDSPRISLSQEAVQGFFDRLSQIRLPYAYEELYGVEECYDRIFTDCTVTEHQASALDANGNLTAEHLVQVVKENNAAWLAAEKNAAVFYTPVGGELLTSICQLIIDVVSHIRQQYPDIDYDRVFCNLGHLKVFDKSGLLSFAQVSLDMTLSISEPMLGTVDLISDKNGVRNVRIHEVMHMIQVGCACEQIEHCSRHAGITYMWDDAPLNGSSWSWLVESSAEQMMTRVTGSDLITYKTMVGYLESVDLATFLSEDVPAYYAETLCFYQDPNRLFLLFGCKTREDNIEVAKMMKAIDIIQMLPDDFADAYGEKYQVDTEDDEAMGQLRRQLKPAIMTTLTKSFYRTLASALTADEGIPANDVCT